MLDIFLFIELDDGKIYRKPLYLMVKTMVSCKFSLKPIQSLMHARTSYGSTICPHDSEIVTHVNSKNNPNVGRYHWIGLRENLQENPIFNGKIDGFL